MTDDLSRLVDLACTMPCRHRGCAMFREARKRLDAAAAESATLRARIRELEAELPPVGSVIIPPACQGDAERRIAELVGALIECEPRLRYPDNGWNVCRWCGKRRQSGCKEHCWYAEEIALLEKAKERVRAVLKAGRDGD